MSRPGGHLGIVELGSISADMRARNIDLFEQLGHWVVDTPDPSLQRLFAEASHLHAWHAELWAQRAPVIPPVELDNSVAAPPAALVDPADRATVYGAALDRLLTELARAAGTGSMQLLDPSTVRTIGLVTADLAALRHRLTVQSSTGASAAQRKLAKLRTAGRFQPSWSSLPCGGQWSSRL